MKLLPIQFIPCVVLLIQGIVLATATLAQEPTEKDTFASIATAFLEKHCIECHDADEPEGDLALENLDLAKPGGDDSEVWIKVVEALKFGRMPPADQTQPSTEDIQQFAGRIQDELRAVGHEMDVDHRLRQPSYANLISHERLFDGSVNDPAYSPSRMWRLHPEAYENFLIGFGRQLKTGGPLSKPFTVGDGLGEASNYAALMQADSATLGQLMLNCRQIAQYQTVGFVKKEKDRRTKEMIEKRLVKSPETFVVIIESDADPTEEQIAAAVVEEFQIVLRRSPTNEELDEFADFLKRSIAIGGKTRGLRTMAMAILLRPESIYRMEVGLGETDRHGRRMLSPYELAYAISFALTDLPPDQLLVGPPKPNDRNKKPQPPSLMDLADSGKLKTRDDVRRIVTQIWDNESIDKIRIVRFFQEFFGYHAAQTVFKGERATRSFATKFFVSDADRLVMHIVDEDRDVLKRLLTTDKFFVQWPGSLAEYERRIKYITDRNNNSQRKDVNYKYFVERTEKGLRPIPQANPTWRETVRFYNLDERTWSYPLEQPFSMPEGQRFGILTHPAWLVAWSGNSGNDPIRRGKWIYEHLLAGSIPDVPITVNAAVPEDPHKTLRDRLQVTRQDYCWKCHQKMDPLGLPFESYTDFGRFRTKEALGDTKALGKSRKTAPVNTSGEIIGSGDPKIDGKVENARVLMQRLADSPRARQSFVRYAFRYWMGRNEMISDSPTLIASENAYVENQGSFKLLVISLLTSDSFLYRK